MRWTPSADVFVCDSPPLAKVLSCTLSAVCSITSFIHWRVFLITLTNRKEMPLLQRLSCHFYIQIWVQSSSTKDLFIQIRTSSWGEFLYFFFLTFQLVRRAWRGHLTRWTDCPVFPPGFTAETVQAVLVCPICRGFHIESTLASKIQPHMFTFKTKIPGTLNPFFKGDVSSKTNLESLLPRHTEGEYYSIFKWIVGEKECVFYYNKACENVWVETRECSWKLSAIFPLWDSWQTRWTWIRWNGSDGNFASNCREQPEPSSLHQRRTPNTVLLLNCTAVHPNKQS